MTDRQTELLVKIQAGTVSEEEEMEFFNSIRPFCYKVATRYKPALRCEDEIDDLMQESFLAVMDAAKAYDPAAGAGFPKWTAFYLHSYFDSYIAAQNGTSRSATERTRKIRRYIADYEAENGHEPTTDEICKRFGMLPETVQILLHRGYEKSMSDELSEEFTLSETIPAPGNLEEDTIERIISAEVRGVLRRFIDDLPENERRACYMYFIRGWTDKQGADNLGVSVSRFQFIRQRGLKKLRRSRNIQELGRYLPERVGSAAYKRPDQNRWQSSTERAAFMDLHEELVYEAQAIKKKVLHEIYHNREGKENDDYSIRSE